VKLRKIRNNILLIGCGQMGSALLEGLLASSYSLTNIVVVEKHTIQAREIRKRFRVKVIESIDSIEKKFIPTIIAFALKPQVMNRVLPHYTSYLERWKRNSLLLVSLAAGYRIENLRRIFGANYNIARIMPNLPVECQRGVIGAFANKLSHSQRRLCEKIFGSLGYFVWVRNEKFLDSLTAFSGSGPAYIFYFCECLEKVALDLGFNSKMASLISRSLILGSSSLLEKSKQSPEDLRLRVTSPGGTTEAAIKILSRDRKFEKLLKKAIFAAKTRAIRLSR
jgi:pyrroline-5-carboxylate reductase|tara:strand:- start:158 stop:997 length:840 start_codon:yes stop_codon:yes gene_type:complete